MEEILQSFYENKIESVFFTQHIDAYVKQYKDGEVYETEVTAYEPCYKIVFKDQSTEEITLKNLLVKLFYKKK